MEQSLTTIKYKNLRPALAPWAAQDPVVHLLTAAYKPYIAQGSGWLGTTYNKEQTSAGQHASFPSSSYMVLVLISRPTQYIMFGALGSAGEFEDAGRMMALAGRASDKRGHAFLGGDHAIASSMVQIYEFTWVVVHHQ